MRAANPLNRESGSVLDDLLTEVCGVHGPEVYGPPLTISLAVSKSQIRLILSNDYRRLIAVLPFIIFFNGRMPDHPFPIQTTHF
jgi:hypothetical protein